MHQFWQAWAALEYMDEVLGRLFDYLKTSGLDKSTYVMLMSDNGAAMLPNERSTVDRLVSICQNMARFVQHLSSCY